MRSAAKRARHTMLSSLNLSSRVSPALLGSARRSSSAASRNRRRPRSSSSASASPGNSSSSTSSSSPRRTERRAPDMAHAMLASSVGLPRAPAAAPASGAAEKKKLGQPPASSLRLPSLPPRANRVIAASNSPAHSIRSEGFWTPSDEGAVKSVWSIRDDLQVPASIYAQGGQGPPPVLAERFQSVITQLFQHRIIRCGGAVDDDMANLIVAQLLYLDAADPNRDIVMYVNSPGGSVTAGMAVFDTMRHIRPDVSTVCVGLAASMGAFLLSGGTKGKRYSLPNSRIMIHQPLGGAQGQQTDIEIQANEILHHKANLNGYLAYHTGQPLEKIVQDTDRDFFMSAKEAKDYGLIDAVISNPLKALQPLPAPVPA